MKGFVFSILVFIASSIGHAQNNDLKNEAVTIKYCNMYVNYPYECQIYTDKGNGHFGRIYFKNTKYSEMNGLLVRPDKSNSVNGSIVVGTLKAILTVENYKQKSSNKKILSSSELLVSGYVGYEPNLYQVVFFVTEVK